MEPDFSREAYLRFMDYLGSKGLLNKATAAARKSAGSKLLSVLDEGEALDLRNLDIDAVSSRFFNLHKTQFTPDSMTTYKSRLKSGIEDFLSYNSNPAGFKPEISRTRQFSSKQSMSGRSRSDEVDPSKQTDFKRRDSVDDLSFPIPVRAGVIVRISGLPADLTQRESQKICNVIMALSVPEEEP